MGAYRRQELVGDGVLDRLVEHRAAPDPLVDHRRRDLPLPEAGNLDLRTDLPVRLLQTGLQLRERHFDGQPHTGRAEGLDGAFHGYS